ncbi:MAG: extracellular solute-binding protein [Arenimonas sp.]|uniref:extracellular solute-binding protein n=1 Tax=Arenimonas sp. TaxID=1872635 RepID=UPI0025C1058D|nr:extracellular solute-binding protein [Arenimonas sp.]MBW8368932.1 extracellular solute-binding protein [Arenimonas sp.]
MKIKMTVLATALLAAACSNQSAPEAGGDAAQAPEAPKVLNVYNWSDYIAEDTIANFEKETGVKVTYDVFDSNEVLEAKLLAGNTGYDIVVPSLTFLSRQIQAGVFQPLDKSRFTQYGNLDSEIMALLAKNDADNAHSVPYLWGTTGIGYNVAKVKAALGDDFPLDSWAMVFEPETLAKLKGCGVAILDTPSEIIPPVLDYLGEEPNSFDEAVIQKAVDRLALLRPSITYFHSSQYINDLANGDICVAIGWSGDIIQAQARAAEADKGVEVSYIIPKEGAPMWFDMLAIPKGAKNVDNAYLFIDYLMRPDVMAGVQNYVAYASANQAALPMVDQTILDDPGIYPTPEARQGLYTLAVLPPEVDRLFTRHWTTLKTGK